MGATVRSCTTGCHFAIDSGAQEIEFVLNLGRLKDGDRKYVLRELRDVAEAADERQVRAVLEASLLTPEETLLACELLAQLRQVSALPGQQPLPAGGTEPANAAAATKCSSP